MGCFADRDLAELPEVDGRGDLQEAGLARA